MKEEVNKILSGENLILVFMLIFTFIFIFIILNVLDPVGVGDNSVITKSLKF